MPTKPKKRKPRRSWGAVRVLPKTKSIQATYVHNGKRYPKTFPPDTKPKVIEDYFVVTRSAIAQGTWVEPGT